MSFKSSKKKADSAIDAFEEAREAVQEFIEDHQAAFNIFYDLSERYNRLLGEARDACRVVEGQDPFSYQSFRRTKAPESWKYEAHLLPAEVLQTPGVVGRVDNKVIESGLVTGAFTVEQIDPARSKKIGTPKVLGPKDISVKVS
jgi:hypothetical protein